MTLTYDNFSLYGLDVADYDDPSELELALLDLSDEPPEPPEPDWLLDEEFDS